MAKFTRTTDYTGRTINRWTVLEYLDDRKRYLCRCRCGTVRELSTSLVQRSKSCGCLRREVSKMLIRRVRALHPDASSRGGKALIKDEAGKRYGHWLVLSHEVRKNRGGYFRCRCDCGKEKIISGGTLRKGESRSCGCQSWRVPGPPKQGWRPRRDEPRAGYASDAELTELILAWQKEEEPSLLMQILSKLDPLTRYLIRLEADWHDPSAEAELRSDIYVKVRRALVRFLPGYSVYSYLRTVIHYTIVGYRSRYWDWINNFISLDAPFSEGEEGEELTLYDLLPAPALLAAA